MTDHEGYAEPMTARFTDTENTGAPMVPMVDTGHLAADGGNHDREEREEVVLSHRLTGSD
jgi:hypothetical protein